MKQTIKSIQNVKQIAINVQPQPDAEEQEHVTASLLLAAVQAVPDTVKAAIVADAVAAAAAAKAAADKAAAAKAAEDKRDAEKAAADRAADYRSKLEGNRADPQIVAERLADSADALKVLATVAVDHSTVKALSKSATAFAGTVRRYGTLLNPDATDAASNKVWTGKGGDHLLALLSL